MEKSWAEKCLFENSSNDTISSVDVHACRQLYVASSGEGNSMYIQTVFSAINIKSFFIKFFLLALVFTLAACAERDTGKGQQEADYTVRLLAREFTPAAGIDPDLSKAIANAQAERLHVLVQFERVPATDLRNRMQEQFSLRILDTIPEKSFFAAVPANESAIEEIFSSDLAIRWIGPIKPHDKIAPGLRDFKAPEYTRRVGEQIEMVVMFFGDIPEENQKTILDTFEMETLDRLGPINGWYVLGFEKQIPDLAEIDEIKWIEQGPAPVEEDNDSVRSATGVSSDAVSPPSAFNLTGANTIVAQWEGTNASLTHPDLSANIILADGPIEPDMRTHRHVEVAVNTFYDIGETIYSDIDDDTVVSIGDWRATVNGALAAGTTVAPGDVDIGTATIAFQATEAFVDADGDDAYTNGEDIYIDADADLDVSIGDTRVTAAAGFPAGSIVVALDGDINTNLLEFPFDPHYHSTHTAGTVMGNGSQSLIQGGSANQWAGVAPGTTLRSYETISFSADYTDAANAGTDISTNSWGTGHHHEQVPPAVGYEFWTNFYDAVISGTQSDGTASGLVRQISIFGSAGNQGRPERHADDITANGQYDNGETILRDNDDDGTVSVGDSVVLSVVAVPAIGTPLVNFALNEMHDESINTFGTYSTTGGGAVVEGIYLDADNSLTVNIGDTRINGAAGFPVGSVVAAGDADITTFLRQFRVWGNVRVPNSAKDTIVVANLRSDTKVPSPSSSRGPTFDGRVKPDISGPGSQAAGDQTVTSTFPRSLYGGVTGTSMSTPAVAGVGALVTEWYKQSLNATGPIPSTLKGILLHSGEDLNTIPNVGAGFNGPDFTFGYGRVQADVAASLVPHHLNGTINLVATPVDYAFTIGEVENLRVTLVWDDPAWTINAAPSAATGMLQNDLDLVLIAPDGTQHTPWILNPAIPTAPATRSAVVAGSPIPAGAFDRLNTVEQVEVAIADAGIWIARVTANTLNIGPQTYTLVTEFVAPQDSPTVGMTPADIWMRDNAADTGAVPSAGTMWLSPDVWNRYAEDDLTGHENPEFGQENYLYANLRNLSATDTVEAISIDIWIAQASTGLAWPNDFSYVGRFPVASMTPGEVRQIGPLPWFPPNPMPSDHFCFYIRVQSPQDPITFAEVPTVGTNARNSNNIAWRNINVVDLASSRTVTFLVRNISREQTPVDLEINIPEEFLGIGAASIELPAKFEVALAERHGSASGIGEPSFVLPRPLQNPELDKIDRETNEALEPKPIPQPRRVLTGPKVFLPGPAMAPGETAVIRLIFGSDQRNKASYDVHVVQKVGGETVGGILYTVRTGYAEGD